MQILKTNGFNFKYDSPFVFSLYFMKTPAIAFVSLGCPKAGADSEVLLARLKAAGFAFTDDAAAAAFVIINTCGFVNDAIDESLSAIEEALSQNKNVFVTGCLGAKKDLILKKFPQVLGVSGPNKHDEVFRQIADIFGLPQKNQDFNDSRILLTPPHFAYLKIAEGCNQQCSFCIIPQLRGALRSRTFNEIMLEAQNLVQSGVKEIIVVAQDTIAYGVDLKYKTHFWNGRPIKSNITELCKALSSLGVWVRLHYVYPYPAVDSLVELMNDGKILPYLDIPLQHANPRILKAMRRPAAIENMLLRIEKWRKICPDIALRSTFIVGFPGETEREFEDLLDFLELAQLDRVGVFEYSAVSGAPANALPNAVADEIKAMRKLWLLEAQAEISQKKLAQAVGKTERVLVDLVDEEGAIARRAYDAPDVDGVVYINDFFDTAAGEFLDVLITDSDAHDLYAQNL